MIIIPKIESIDTSNPIMAALDGTRYTEQGLTTKPKANMNDNFEIDFKDICYEDILHNTTLFREINGIKIKYEKNSYVIVYDYYIMYKP